MASAKVVLRKNKARKDGMCPLAIRVTIDRKTKFIFLSVYIDPNHWDSINNRVKKANPNAARINNLILKKLSETNDILLAADAENKEVSSLHVKKKLKRNGQTVTFFVLAAEFIKDKEAQGRINTAHALRAQISNIRKFNNNEDLFFSDITPAFLEKLRLYLKVERGNSPRSIMNHFIITRTLFNKAIRDGFIDAKYYPFGKEKIKIKLPETIKIGLDEEEMKRLINLDLSNCPGKFHARNAWLFSFYLAGMRISDVLKTRWSDFKEGRLYYRMGKNEKVLSIAVPQKITEILEHYKADNPKPSDFVFPDLRGVDMKDHQALNTRILTTCKRFNMHMKVVAKRAGIEKNISNHIARHTFGNIAGDKISPQMLQKLYRHTDIKTTMGYQANFIHKNADEALELVINF